MDNVYELPGLDPKPPRPWLSESWSDIATRYRQDQHCPAAKLLGGFPLALEVVLANLARQTPKEVLSAFQAGDVVWIGQQSEEDGEHPALY